MIIDISEDGYTIEWTSLVTGERKTASIVQLIEAFEAEPIKHQDTESWRTTATEGVGEYAPIKHGRWIDAGDSKLHCTSCHGYIRRIIPVGYDYCPYCGARMDTPNNAHWIKQLNGEYKCSVCGDTTLAPLYECRTCGARMGGVENG